MKFLSLNYLIKPRFVGVLISIATAIFLWMNTVSSMASADWTPCVLEPLSPIFDLLVPQNSYLSYLIGLCCVLFFGIMLYFLNESFLFIKERSLLPFFLYVLIMGCNPNVHSFSPAYVGSFVLLFVFWQLFECYHGASPIKQCFNMGALLALGSMVCVELILFIFPMWIGMQRLNVFNVRTFFASLFGLLCPFFVVGAVLYVFYDIDMAITAVWNSISLEYLTFNFTVSSLIYLGAIFVCMVVSIIYAILHSVGNRMHVVRMQGVISICFFLCFVLFFLMPGKPDITFPLLAMFAALSLSNYFTMQRSLFSSILFYVFVIALLILYISI